MHSLIATIGVFDARLIDTIFTFDERLKATKGMVDEMHWLIATIGMF